MGLRELLNWIRSSLLGHIVFFGVLCGVPFFLIFLQIISSQEGLTVSWAIYMAFVCAIIWGLAGVFFWYAVSKPMRERRKRQ